jgi:hypothetical protein
MEAAGSYETLVMSYLNIQSYIPEDSNLIFIIGTPSGIRAAYPSNASRLK